MKILLFFCMFLTSGKEETPTTKSIIKSLLALLEGEHMDKNVMKIKKNDEIAENELETQVLRKDVIDYDDYNASLRFKLCEWLKKAADFLESAYYISKGGKKVLGILDKLIQDLKFELSEWLNKDSWNSLTNEFIYLTISQEQILENTSTTKKIKSEKDSFKSYWTNFDEIFEIVIEKFLHNTETQVFLYTILTAQDTIFKTSENRIERSISKSTQQQERGSFEKLFRVLKCLETKEQKNMMSNREKENSEFLKLTIKVIVKLEYVLMTIVHAIKVPIKETNLNIEDENIFDLEKIFLKYINATLKIHRGIFSNTDVSKRPQKEDTYENQQKSNIIDDNNLILVFSVLTMYFSNFDYILEHSLYNDCDVKESMFKTKQFLLTLLLRIKDVRKKEYIEKKLKEIEEICKLHI
ncbi:hypothetical protein EDEG_03440 [Edhazardia aedis USNM 41457]|uniref:Uncharacterized protein n=1 Tax=Edhazardia aedis (strain USNM 41457) TaxID=1003232 RepID=J8ZR03_EDHAE|nr:hypothetical protein EDEG_03440 [Edhazardia aedis USNM 41457]|eukprot:EJW02108.1 hypothetical protein EDEG_03440 [Edhazardia aedis USNM 41457]